MSKNFILVGAKPSGINNKNPGGQLTASLGLLEYAKLKGYSLDVIDTTQSSFPVPPLNERLKKGVKRLIVLRKKLSTLNIDGLIVFSSAGFSFYERILMCLLAKVYNVQSVFFMRDGHFIEAIKKSWMANIMAKLMLRVPSTICAQGVSWGEVFEELGVPSNRISVVRNWLPIEFQIKSQGKRVDKSQRLRFVFVGWLVAEKGVLELMRAAKYLLQEYNYDFELIMVGDGTLRKELEDDIEESLLEDYIKITGWQSKQDVLKYLLNAHVFLLPSKVEGFPNAMLEAMALGLPAICTNVGAISESLHNSVNGYLLPDGSAESIIDAMLKYLQFPELVEKHSIESLSIVHKQHSFEQNCRELFDQFN